MLPYRELSDAAARAIDDSRASLQYGTPEYQIKESIVELMRMREVECHINEVFLTTGAQQALSLLVQLLLPSVSRSVLVEEVVYPGFRQALEPFNPRLVPVRTDFVHGLDIEAADWAIRQSRPKPTLFYTTCVGHNPLSLTMSAGAHNGLMELLCRHRITVIEDDVYGLLQYENRAVPPLRALSKDGVVYVGSFSKILAPSLRVGWIVAPPKYIAALSALKEGSDINTATLSQRIIASYIERHSLSSRLNILRDNYRVRRDTMHRELLCELDGIAQWQKPTAGFFMWLHGVGLGDTTKLLSTAMKRRVDFVPGTAFSVARSQRYRSTMRISFSHCPAEAMREAVVRLAASIRDHQPRRAA
jgi:2-aminoadipate transaminase